MICKICQKDKAVVPDRNGTSSRKEVCRKCHGERLLGDLRYIMKTEKKKREDWEKR